MRQIHYYIPIKKKKTNKKDYNKGYRMGYIFTTV